MIRTERLDIVAADPETVCAALEGSPRLASVLGAIVPATWPPEFLDAAAFQFTIERLAQGPEQAGWWLQFVILRDAPEGPVLVGSAGFKGPPKGGVVEIGYGIVKDRQRRGYATEVVAGLVRHAFNDTAVDLVIAETLPDLAPSIGVLEKSRFRFAGNGSEPGVIRYEMSRAEYAARRGA